MAVAIIRPMDESRRRFLGESLLLASATILPCVPYAATVEEFIVETPADVLLRYLRAVYARDFKAAYPMISPADSTIKSEAIYLQENRSLDGEALRFSRLLASLIVITGVKTELNGARAKLSFRARLPDANAPRISEITAGFDQIALGRLALEEREMRVRELVALARSSKLPMVESPNEEWELVRVNGRWWVDLNWAGAVLVRFHAAAMAGLPWQFEPGQREVHALPGETSQVIYRLKNPTHETMTGKARHIITPGGENGHIEIVSCFCFLEQTLRPDQAINLPVMFRLGYDVPVDIRNIDVRYEFYPVAAFPKGKGV